MQVFRRWFSLRPRAPTTPRSPALEEPQAAIADSGQIQKLAADINIKHNFAVQQYSRQPYDLKTRVVLVSHPSGFLATLEWRWKDPNRDGRSVVAVTSGINVRKKLAIADACRAMLLKQKLIDDSVSAQKEAVSELEDLIAEEKYSDACKLLQQASMHSNVPLGEVQHLFPKLWRFIIATHDERLTESLLSVLEHSKSVAPSLYEQLIQELVFLSDFNFSERTLLSLLSDRIRLSLPERGLMASGDSTSPAELEKWKYWRSLIAIEELSNIHTSLRNRDQLPCFRLQMDSGTTIPIIRLRGDISNEGISPESLVVLFHQSDPDKYMTGRVLDSSMRPDGVFSISVSLLTEEKQHDIFLEDEVDVIVLSESRITFERINASLREFYRISSIPDPLFRFNPKMRNLLLNPTIVKSTTFAPPNLTREKRYLNLSDVQLEAVVHALAHPVTLVHGPAGTGKTHTLCGIVSAWRASNDSRILCCADSNTAADNIHEALRRRNIPSFRLGAWKALSDVPEDVLASLPNKVLVERYRGALTAFNADPVRYRGFLIGARKQIEEEALRHFKVVVTTLSSARNSNLDKIVFPSVIIDESAQTIEPASLLAVSHGCERLVLIGDHKQLPAVVLSKEAVRLGLHVSLFERLMKSGSVISVLLNRQRRMHPSISAWPNMTFYEGKLEDDESCSTDHDLVDFKTRVMFIDTEGVGSEELVGTSTRNLSESSILGGVIERLLVHAQPYQIGVIVPYLAQKALLLKHSKHGIQINTVEGFQGHEKDLIVISTTRSNALGTIGFLEDDQRMNVMLTRARRGLVVVGDGHTLRKSGGRWAEWLEWCSQHGTITTAKTFHYR